LSGHARIAVNLSLSTNERARVSTVYTYLFFLLALQTLAFQALLLQQRRKPILLGLARKLLGLFLAALQYVTKTP
jgi:hypothetical protein